MSSPGPAFHDKRWATAVDFDFSPTAGDGRMHPSASAPALRAGGRPAHTSSASGSAMGASAAAASPGAGSPTFGAGAAAAGAAVRKRHDRQRKSSVEDGGALAMALLAGGIGACPPFLLILVVGGGGWWCCLSALLSRAALAPRVVAVETPAAALKQQSWKDRTSSAVAEANKPVPLPAPRFGPSAAVLLGRPETSVTTSSGSSSESDASDDASAADMRRHPLLGGDMDNAAASSPSSSVTDSKVVFGRDGRPLGLRSQAYPDALGAVQDDAHTVASYASGMFDVHGTDVYDTAGIDKYVDTYKRKVRAGGVPTLVGGVAQLTAVYSFFLHHSAKFCSPLAQCSGGSEGNACWPSSCGTPSAVCNPSGPFSLCVSCFPPAVVAWCACRCCTR